MEKGPAFGAALAETAWIAAGFSSDKAALDNVAAAAKIAENRTLTWKRPPSEAASQITSVPTALVEQIVDSNLCDAEGIFPRRAIGGRGR